MTDVLDDDDDFVAEEEDFEEKLTKYQLDERRRKLREKIELMQMAKQLDIGADDWSLAFDDL
jgi:hypothetical protein